MRYRILTICGCFSAGVFKSMRPIINDLDTELFEHHVVFSPRRETPHDWRSQFSPKTTFYEWKCDRNINIKRDLVAVGQLYKLIRRIEPDLIHARSSKAGIVRLLSPIFRDIPIIYTPHAFSFLQSHLSASRRFALLTAEWLLALTGGEVIGVSPSELANAKRITSRASHITNMCDIGEIHRALEGHASPQPYRSRLLIGMCGRGTPQKNFPLFAEVARRLDPYDFCWIGEADDVQSTNLPRNLTVTGWIPWREAIRIMNSLDIYIHTALWEGVPNTILEAMALHKPIVAYRCAGNMDAVRQGNTGFCADRVDEFIDYINLLATAPGLREYLGKNGGTRVEAEFGPERYLAEWSRTYVERIQHHGRNLARAMSPSKFSGSSTTAARADAEVNWPEA